MRACRHVLCGEAKHGPTPAGANDCVRITTLGPFPEVNLSIEQINRQLWRNVSDRFLDLIEIASYVYTADQMTTRGGPGVEDMGDAWRRHFHFVIPVRELDVWNSEEVRTTLRDTLSFLSEDRYDFEFRQFRHPPSPDSYLGLWSESSGPETDEVMLFSGGLDSLAGAVRSVVELGRRVLLVTHMPTSKLLDRHKALRAQLSARARGPKPTFVTISINKDRELSLEHTQRSRSFLFASLAMAIGQASGVNGFNFYENGVVSLNFPISPQVVGAKATRTTHPRVIAGLRNLFSALAQRRIEIENQFVWKTKTDVVRAIVQAGCGEMIEHSMSCTHTRELSLAVTHCGRCSQCIDRRIATLGASASNFDPAGIYATDLLLDDRSRLEDRTLFASYVETARQVAKYTETQFYGRYGEIGRVVRWLKGSPEQTAHSIYELYRRHGLQVQAVIDAAVAEHAPKFVDRSLKPHCGLRLVVDQASLGHTVEVRVKRPEVPPYAFQQVGEFWKIRFAGGEDRFYQAAIGLVHLFELIRSPHQRFGGEDLLVRAHGMKAAIPLGIKDAVIDAGAKRAHSLRVAVLRHELAQAERDNDFAAMESARGELRQAANELQRLGWQERPASLDRDRNRVRNSVCNAITRIIEKMKNIDKPCGNHFESSISLGHTVAYVPTAPVDWQF